MSRAGKLTDHLGRLARRVGDGLRGLSRRESRRLLALHRASVVLAAETNPDAALRHTLRSAVTLLDAGSWTLYRWDADAGLLRCAHNWRVPARDSTPDQRPGEGLAGQAFVQGAPLVVNDHLRWEHAMGSGRRAGLRAALSVPLLRGAKSSG